MADAPLRGDGPDAAEVRLNPLLNLILDRDSVRAELRPVGAGITLWINAMKALRKLGIGDEVTQNFIGTSKIHDRFICAAIAL